MDFVWDKNKRKKNMVDHSIDFAELKKVWKSLMVTRIDDREDYDETRWVSLGNLDGAIVVLVYTERKNKVRLISARRATKNETNIYFKKIAAY